MGGVASFHGQMACRADSVWIVMGGVVSWLLGIIMVKCDAYVCLVLPWPLQQPMNELLLQYRISLQMQLMT